MRYFLFFLATALTNNVSSTVDSEFANNSSIISGLIDQLTLSNVQNTEGLENCLIKIENNFSAELKQSEFFKNLISLVDKISAMESADATNKEELFKDAISEFSDQVRSNPEEAKHFVELINAITSELKLLKSNKSVRKKSIQEHKNKELILEKKEFSPSIAPEVITITITCLAIMIFAAHLSVAESRQKLAHASKYCVTAISVAILAYITLAIVISDSIAISYATYQYFKKGLKALHKKMVDGKEPLLEIIIV